MWVTLSFHVVRRPKSDCQAGPVSQDQIRQREHDIEFCLLFSEASVSGLLEFEQTLYDTEDMLHFCPDRGFCVFTLFGFVLTTFAELTNLAWTTIDSILDLLTSFVSCDGIRALFSPDIATITIYRFFLSVQELRSYRYVMNIGGRGFYGMHNAAVPVYANMCLIPEMPGIAFLGLAGIGIALLFLVLRGGWR